MELVAVGVAELDFGERSTTAGVVDDLLDYTANVAMALSEIVGAELRGGLVESCCSLSVILVHRSVVVLV